MIHRERAIFLFNINSLFCCFYLFILRLFKDCFFLIQLSLVFSSHWFVNTSNIYIIALYCLYFLFSITLAVTSIFKSLTHTYRDNLWHFLSALMSSPISLACIFWSTWDICGFTAHLLGTIESLSVCMHMCRWAHMAQDLSVRKYSLVTSVFSTLPFVWNDSTQFFKLIHSWLFFKSQVVSTLLQINGIFFWKKEYISV